jgi:hypothetical protein
MDEGKSCRFCKMAIEEKLKWTEEEVKERITQKEFKKHLLASGMRKRGLKQHYG